MELFKVREDLTPNTYYGGVMFKPEMIDIRGKVGTIIDDCGQGIYKTSLSPFVLSDEMFEKGVLMEFEAEVKAKVRFHVTVTGEELHFLRNQEPVVMEAKDHRDLFSKMERAYKETTEVDYFDKISFKEVG